jgi:N-acetylmuramoyl-L-alanine amidase
MVAEEMRAWHAGQACWRDEEDINSCSIGIEIHNAGHEFGYPDFPEKQMKAVEALCLDILERNEIPPHRVLAHSDVAPARKADPGEKFDWKRLADAGVGLWVEPEPLSEGSVMKPGDEGNGVRGMQALLQGYGYGLTTTGTYDEATEQVVTAFQRHFRPEKVDGLVDQSTLITIGRLTGKC